MAYYILKSYKLKADPLTIFKALNTQKNCFFLDSSLNSNHSLGRYSFLGVDPFFVIRTKHRDPFPIIREKLRAYPMPKHKSGIPFLGGGFGYFAYDLGFALENKVKPGRKLELGIPDCVFGFYNTVIVIDNFKKMLYISLAGFPERKYTYAKSLCENNLNKVHKLLLNINKDQENIITKRHLELKSNFSKDRYFLAIKQAKEYIRQGDIYQVNLSQQFESKTNLSGVEIYRRLRNLSPSFFGSYFNVGDFEIISSSPERFLKVDSGIVSTRPMKGTRPRGNSRFRDKALRSELLKSKKDKAELVMIVDLERNDLGRVCNYDSIKVKRLREIEKYNTVFQTTSTIEGRMYKDKDNIDLLRASFPGGSITGCPKIRAMQIIEELEPSRRGIYTGCLGYLSFSGNMDSSVLIRTILKQKDKVSFGVGGGIVADSNPEMEYKETLVKAKAMIAAIS